MLESIRMTGIMSRGKISAILFVLLLLLFIGLVLVKNNNTFTDNIAIDNNLTKTDADKTNQSNIQIPEFTVESSDIVFPLMNEELYKWAGDALIMNISAIGGSIGAEGSSAGQASEKIYYGAENGEFSSYLMSVFSKSKAQLNNVSWESGKIIVGTGSDLDKVSLTNYENIKMISPNINIISSERAFEIAKANGMDDVKNKCLAYVFTEFSTDKIYWEYNERSRTEVDAKGLEIIIAKYKIDAVTGDYLGKTE